MWSIGVGGGIFYLLACRYGILCAYFWNSSLSQSEISLLQVRLTDSLGLENVLELIWFGRLEKEL
jgi:hypothetical protein